MYIGLGQVLAPGYSVCSDGSIQTSCPAAATPAVASAPVSQAIVTTAPASAPASSTAAAATPASSSTMLYIGLAVAAVIAFLAFGGNS
jgi:hypothetical protein